MSDSALDLLRAESDAQRIGPLWIAEIRSACVDVSRRFDPAVYGVAEAVWSAGEIDELMQDVTIEQLLRQGQLDYIIDVSDQITDVRRLLRHQVRRALVRRRRLTVVDRLLTRISSLLDSSDAYEPLEGVVPARFRPIGSGFGVGPPRDEQVRRASAAVRLLPTSSAAGDRAPTVFRTEVLAQLVSLCFEACEASLSIDDFGRILRDSLTSWIPVVLELDEELDLPSEATAELLSDLELAVSLIIDGLNDTHRLVLATKFRGLSDSELAERLSVSRPTAAKAKGEAFAALRVAWETHTGELSPVHDDKLAQLLYLRLGDVSGKR